MKKLVFQMQLLLLAILFTTVSKSNANSILTGDDNDSLWYPSDTCEANFFYYALGNGQFIFYDSLSVYNDDASIIWAINESTYLNVHRVAHTFPEGTKWARVTLTITNNDTHTCINSQEFLVQPDTPSYCNAEFDYAVSDTVFGDFTRIQFINTSFSNNPFTSSYWSFGDGGYSNDMYPIHDYYYANDSMLVGLIITTSSGCMDSVYHHVYIPGTSDTTLYPCEADFGYEIIGSDTTLEEFTRIQFTNTSITGNSITSTEWNFGDGGYSSDMHPIHEYYTAYDTVFSAGLIIATSSGCRDTVFHYVYIPKKTDTTIYTCQADFTYEIFNTDTLGISYQVVNFNNTSSGINLSYQWYFGDTTFSTDTNPSHVYYFNNETTVIVTLIVNSSFGCTDTLAREITIPASKKLYSLSGVVTGKNELLPQGTMVLYKKANSGYFEIEDANVINNGYFAFDGLQEGKYLLYAMPHMYYTGKYLPTYYVNKLQWYKADAIDLKSNTAELTLELATTRYLGNGQGHISGTIKWNSGAFKSSKTMKSMETETPALVYLYTESGEVVDMCAPDEFNNFAFDDLIYGTYFLTLESVNLPENKTTVTLSPEIPNVNEVEFIVDGYTVGFPKINSETGFKVYRISDEEVGIQITQGGTYKVAFINISGMCVFETTEDFSASDVKVMSIGNIPDGIYMIRLQNNTSVFSQKIRK